MQLSYSYLLPAMQSIEGPAAGRTTTLTTHPDTARTTITTTTSTHATTSATTSATTTSRQGSMLDTTWLQRHKPLPYQHTLPYASPRTPHHAAHPGGYSGHWGSQPASTITYSLSPADSWAEEECLVGAASCCCAALACCWLVMTMLGVAALSCLSGSVGSGSRVTRYGCQRVYIIHPSYILHMIRCMPSNPSVSIQA